MKRLAISIEESFEIEPLVGDVLVVSFEQKDLASLYQTVSNQRDGFHDLGECTDVPPVPLRYRAVVYDFDVEAYIVECSSDFAESTLPNGDTISNCLNNCDCCWLPKELILPYRSEKTGLCVLVEVADDSLRFMFSEKDSGTWKMTKPIRIYESEI
jgi:hypothetical protein